MHIAVLLWCNYRQTHQERQVALEDSFLLYRFGIGHECCYIRVEHAARLEWRGCDQDVWLSGDGVSALGTR